MDPRDEIENWFTYHKPFSDQPARYERIRAKAKELAVVIEECCAPCADRTATMRLLRLTIMSANSTIACNELPPW